MDNEEIFQMLKKMFIFYAEYLAGEDLLENVNDNDDEFGLTEDQVKSIMIELVVGVTNLHNSGFIHRDLKLENVMIDEDGHVAIIDFGSTIQMVEAKTHGEDGITTSYLPPEGVRKEAITIENASCCDWWAVGVIMYEMAMKTRLYDAKTSLETKRNILEEKIPRIHHFSEQANDLVQKLLEENPNKRLGNLLF